MVDEITQKIKQVSLKNEDLLLDPKFTREMFTSNRYQNTLALLEGWTGNKVKLLRCMTSGVLKTAPVATGLEEYKVESGIAVDAYHADDTFEYDDPYSRWDILIETYDCEIAFRNKTDTAWGDDMALTKGWHSLDLVSKGVRVQNRTVGENTVYQVTVYR